MKKREFLTKAAVSKKRRYTNAVAMVNKGGKTVIVRKNSAEPSLLLVTT